MKQYSAVVKDKQTKQTILIQNKEYSTKAKFISDLKSNGYAVDPNKVKESEVFEYIMKNTNCEPQEWKYINRIPNENELITDMMETGYKKDKVRSDKRFNKLMEDRNKNHEQFLQDTGMTEEEWQEWKSKNLAK